MTTDDTTFTYDICGRTITFKRMKDAQMLLLRRLVVQWREVADDGDNETLMRAFDDMNVKVLRVIEAMIVDPGDVAFLEDKMLGGEVELADLQPVLSGGKVAPPEPVADDRPRKAVKKAAKKVARPTRTRK